MQLNISSVDLQYEVEAWSSIEQSPNVLRFRRGSSPYPETGICLHLLLGVLEVKNGICLICSFRYFISVDAEEIRG